VKGIEFETARSAGEAFLGMEVSWDIGDSADSVKINRVEFTDLFTRFGAEMPAKAPSVESSLPKACRIGWGHSTKVDARLVSMREQSRPDKSSPMVWAAYYRVSEEGERDRWEIGARVRLEGGTAVVRPPVDGDYNEAAKKWADKCAQYANEREHFAFNADVSEALVSFGSQLGWVSRRASGGVYFLPGALGGKFMSVLDGLERTCGGSFMGHATPQFADPRTLKTWQHRTAATFAEEVADLEAKLTDMTSRSNVRPTTFDIRAAECAKLAERAKAYTEVLQGRLKPLLAKIKSVEAQFAAGQKHNEAVKQSIDERFNRVQSSLS
jgi:hypothetical protein